MVTEKTYQCAECGHIHAARFGMPEACKVCGGHDIRPFDRAPVRSKKEHSGASHSGGVAKSTPATHGARKARERPVSPAGPVEREPAVAPSTRGRKPGEPGPIAPEPFKPKTTPRKPDERVAPVPKPTDRHLGRMVGAAVAFLVVLCVGGFAMQACIATIGGILSGGSPMPTVSVVITPPSPPPSSIFESEGLQGNLEGGFDVWIGRAAVGKSAALELSGYPCDVPVSDLHLEVITQDGGEIQSRETSACVQVAEISTTGGATLTIRVFNRRSTPIRYRLAAWGVEGLSPVTQ